MCSLKPTIKLLSDVVYVCQRMVTTSNINKYTINLSDAVLGSRLSLGVFSIKITEVHVGLNSSLRIYR